MLCFHHKKCAKLHKQSQFTSKFIAEFIPTSVRNISDGSRYNTGLLIGREKKSNYMGFSEMSWLVPGFLQHDFCLVVLERSSLVVVVKFQDIVASLQQLDSPKSQDKFQICCIDMYLIRFLANFVVFYVFLWILRDFADLPEFCGSASLLNIRSPGT